ncbi:MAG TPA: tryptophan synthase subunit alpha [Planctomycetaceae bacterium]|nr:tryptophan synthase subunit alpha [Planctomycetaceae bacterium]
MTQPTRIAVTFAALKAQCRMAFMPFITVGDPDVATSVALIRELAGRGVDLIEVGFPYSDPIADGPVIQASYTRALSRGLRVHDIFAGIQQLTSSPDGGGKLPPLVAMVSYAIVFRMGVTTFVQRANEAGFAGLIIPDLPADEAADVARIIRDSGLDAIQLVAPTTTPEREDRIVRTASGFVYCISVAGTTGAREQLPPELASQLKRLRSKTDLPLAVGFGVSRPEQVGTLRGLADGVIVGSAIVRQLERLSNGAASAADVIHDVGDFAARMVATTKAN